MTMTEATERHFSGWHKSTWSGGDADCIEVGEAPDGTIGVRDSKNRSGPVLEFDPRAWTSFLNGVRDGDFDR
jgi:hypothetical protein